MQRDASKGGRCQAEKRTKEFAGKNRLVGLENVLDGRSKYSKLSLSLARSF